MRLCHPIDSEHLLDVQTSITLINTNITHIFFRYILIGLNANTCIKNLELNLSGNSFGVNGCHVLECFMAENQTIGSLDISDNG